VKHIMAPSILAADYRILGEQLRVLDEAGAEWVHIDVMDGMFVPNIAVGVPIISSIRKGSDRFFDVHLMIEDPIRYIDVFADAGADGITFHVEAAPDPGAVIAAIRAEGKKAGISLKPGTELASVLPYLDQVDLVLVMTVEPGFGGQAFREDMLDKIRELRRSCREKGLDTDIEVDGGITLGNLGAVLDAGANVIVAGSSMFRGDIGKNVKDFTAEAGKHPVGGT